MTEQVERTVEVEQNGDTHVEVCRVSQCSEVVSLDSNLRPLSGKSGEDGPTLEDEEKHPMSTVSSSSHVLQLLKEDQDDDLPPSASQCSCRNEPASETASVHSFKNKNTDEADEESRAGSAASVSHSRAATPHSTADIDEMHKTGRFKPPTSRASCRSSKAEAAASETVADDDGDEEIMRLVSGLSGHTDGSLQSSFCPLCGGSKRSFPNSRSSHRSRRSRNASPNNAPPDDDDGASNVSGVSTKSNKTNHSNHDCFSASNVTQSRPCSAMSKMSSPETKEEDGATSVKSHRSNTSHKSSCNGSTGDKAGERIPSAMSARSRKSHGSNNNEINDTNVQIKEELGDDERALSSLSAKTGVSSKTNQSVKLCVLDACHSDSPTVEEDTTDKRPASVLDQTGEMERPDSVLSAKSNASGKTSQSHRSNRSKYGTAESPCADAPDELQDEGRETEERATSTNSCRSRKASERSNSPRSKPEHNNGSVSKMSGRSDKTNASVMSSKSCKSNGNINETVTVNVTEGEEKEIEAMEEETQQAESVASSCKSNEKQGPTSKSRDTPLDPQNDAGLVRATSAMSTKSKSSARSSHKSNSGRNVQIISPNASSGKNSAFSHKSSHHGVTDAAVETADAESCISECSHGQSLSPKIKGSPKFNSSKVSPTPPSSPQFLVEQLLPDPTVSETRGPSALSVHSVKSVKSGRSKCSCGAASSNKEMEGKEDRDVKSGELSEQPSSILSPSTKRLRKESGGTEEPLSRNSSGSISIELPEDAASSDSWKSSVSGRNRGKTRSPDGAVMEDVNRLSGSILSQKSNFNESKSTHDLPTINIPTIKTPGQSQESGEQNPVRADSAVTSRSSRSHKTCNCSVKSRSSRSASRPMGSHGDELDDKALSTASSASAQLKKGSKTPEGDSVSRPTSKVKNKDNVENDKADSILSKSPCCLSPDVAPLEDSKCFKVTPNGSLKTSTSKRKESPIKSSSPSPDPNTKLETCSESTLSQSLSAADLLKETVAAARPSSHHSKTSKTSNKPRSEKTKHQGNKNQTPCKDLELTPTCLPNASPNEVVSEWLKNIPSNSSMLDFTDELHVEEEHEKVEENPVEEAAEDERPQDETADEEEKSKHVEEEENEEEEINVEGAAGDTGVPPQPKFLLRNNDSVPRNWESSAAVMKVLLSSSLGRCQSLPEVRKCSFTQIYIFIRVGKEIFSVF